jgi:hypothetical protein
MQNQQGFILISLLLLGMIISILAMASLNQSRLAAYFAQNLLNKLAIEQVADQALSQAELKLAKEPSFKPKACPSLQNTYAKADCTVSLIAKLYDSLNYFDQGGSDIAQIEIKAGADNLPNQLILQAIWWQRRANQSYAEKNQTFLAKNGQIYQLSIQAKPLRLQFNNSKQSVSILLPKTLLKVGQPLLAESKQLAYADQLYLADSTGQIWLVDLSLSPSQWHLAKLLKLPYPPLLGLSLWLALSPQDKLELYIATAQDIEAWQVSKPVKLLWQTKTLQPLLCFFIEAKRIWWVAKTGFNQMTIGALGRLTGQALPAPLFYNHPDQTELELKPRNSDYNWRLQPDNLRKIESLYIAGTEVLFYPPKYEIGQQSLRRE